MIALSAITMQSLLTVYPSSCTGNLARRAKRAIAEAYEGGYMNILSYGGGVNSTAILCLAARHEIAIDRIVYADLGSAESPDTQRYISDYAIPYAQRIGIPFDTVSAGDLYDAMINNPNFVHVPFQVVRSGLLKRQCTYHYKIRPIRRYIRSIRGADPVTLILGIALDEIHRMRDSDVRYIVHSYPLIDRRMDRYACRKLILDSGIPVPPRSSCWFCPYRRAQDQRDVVSRYPYLRDMGIRLESVINESRLARHLDPITVFRYDESQLTLDFCADSGYCDV